MNAFDKFDQPSNPFDQFDDVPSAQQGWMSDRQVSDGQQAYSAADRTRQFTKGANLEIADVLGWPVDVVNAALDYAGFGASEPVGGSGYLKRKMQEHGMIDMNADDTAFTKAGKYVVDGVMMAMATLQTGGKQATRELMSEVTKAGKATQPSASAAKNIVAQMAKPAIQNPTGAMLAEVGGGSGAALGGYLASEYIDPKYEPLGEILGGVTGGQLADIGGRYVSGLVNRFTEGKRSIGPWFRDAVDPRSRAVRRLSEVSENPEAALRAMERNARKVTEGTYQTPASKTGDKHLMALEGRVLDHNPELYNYVDDASGRASRIIDDEARDFAATPIESAQANLSRNVKSKISELDSIVDDALDKARSTTDKIGTSTDRASVNTVVREKVDIALKAARKTEKELWDKVDDAIPVSADDRTGLQLAYKEKISEYLDKDEIPSFMKENLQGKGIENIKTIGDMKRIRSRTLRRIRAETSKSDTDWDMVRVLNDFQNDILDFMRSSGPMKEIDDARAFSSELHKKFSRGAVGKILGFDPTGGASIHPELTLERTIGAGGPKGAVAEKEIAAAAGDISGDIDSYIRSRINFINSEGKISVEPATRFLRDNAELLKKHPAIKSQIENAISTEKSLKSLTKEISASKSAVTKSLERSLSEGRPGDFASKILNGQNPTETTARIYSSLGDDGKRGMKSAFIRYVVDGGDYAKHRKSINAVLSKAERVRMLKIMNSINESKFPKEGLPKIEKPIDDTQAWVLGLITRVIGARAGGWLSQGTPGGSIQSAAIGAGAAKKILKSLTSDKAVALLEQAVKDEDIYKSLLFDAAKMKSMPPKFRAQKAEKAWITLQGWMIANGIEKIEGIEQDE